LVAALMASSHRDAARHHRGSPFLAALLDNPGGRTSAGA